MPPQSPGGGGRAAERAAACRAPRKEKKAGGQRGSSLQRGCRGRNVANSKTAMKQLSLGALTWRFLPAATFPAYF